jgi:hypothetical protein
MAVMTMQNESESKRSDAQLWAGVLMGPIGWALDEGLSYALDQHSCSTGHFYVMHVITAFCLVFALTGVVIARRQLMLTGQGSEEGGSPRDRSWWMARVGIALGISFSIVIVAMAVPKVILSPCD